ncbi:MAG: class I SAM-dependent methyltransferase [Lysobacterales bacterium]
MKKLFKKITGKTQSKLLYEQPLMVSSLDQCNFYHSTDIPGVGLVEGQWDLRAGFDDYLGSYDFTGKRVLEIGPATGFLTFQIEKTALEVVAVELPMDRNFWNAVPYENLGLARGRDKGWTEVEKQFHDHIGRIRNGFWFCHERFASEARVYHGSAENLPPELGEFDVVLLASILLHSRSPVAILESCARLVTGSIIITEVHDPALGEGPVCSLVPTQGNKAWDTWWRFTPRFFTQFLEVLGFTEHRVTFHQQLADKTPLNMFTIISSRPATPGPD